MLTRRDTPIDTLVSKMGYPLAMAWAHLRTLRLADGPDEVNKRAIAKHELGKYREGALT